MTIWRKDRIEEVLDGAGDNRHCQAAVVTCGASFKGRQRQGRAKHECLVRKELEREEQPLLGFALVLAALAQIPYTRSIPSRVSSPK